jgi:hypothetical protein
MSDTITGYILSPTVRGEIHQISINGGVADFTVTGIPWDIVYSTFIKNASLGPKFIWTNGYLDVSVTGGTGSGASQAYIDGSLALRDVSILWLQNNTLNLSSLAPYATNASVGLAIQNFTTNVSINTALGYRDTSISGVWTKLGNVDTSLGLYSATTVINTQLGYRDTSISGIWTKFGSVDTSLLNLGTKNVAQDTSLNAIWTALNPFATNASVGLALGAYATNASINTAAFAKNASLGLYPTNASVGLAIAPFATNASVGLAIAPFATNASVGLAIQPYATNASIGTAAFAKNASIGGIAGKNFWTGTDASYISLGSYDSNTIYFTT